MPLATSHASHAGARRRIHGAAKPKRTWASSKATLSKLSMLATDNGGWAGYGATQELLASFPPTSYRSSRNRSNPRPTAAMLRLSAKRDPSMSMRRASQYSGNRIRHMKSLESATAWTASEARRTLQRAMLRRSRRRRASSDHILA